MRYEIMAVGRPTVVCHSADEVLAHLNDVPDLDECDVFAFRDGETEEFGAISGWGFQIFGLDDPAA